MKRGLVLSLALVGLMGAVGLAQCYCCTPAERPPCYSAFWLGESVQIELKVPWRLCCCCAAPQVVGWRVETWPQGELVYSVSLEAPVAASDFSASWDQTDLSGAQVPAGYYTVVVSTTEGEYEAYLKLVEKAECGCFFWWHSRSWPCGWSLCEPRVILSRACVPRCRIELHIGACCP